MTLNLKNILNRSRIMFKWRYFRGQTPWDTQVTPPEVMEFVQKTRAGKALDLGCGTGTNAITLAYHGWTVTGVDFVAKAIKIARRKAANAGLDISFLVADVADLNMLSDLYDYALDIGCFFALDEQNRTKYANTVSRLLKPGACFMLYAWLPRSWRGKIWGLSPEEVDFLLNAYFSKIRIEIGEEKGHGSAWYWYEHK